MRCTLSYPEWQFAMSKEILLLECTDTWDLVPHPPSVVLIM
jgi:hypothetical protein